MFIKRSVRRSKFTRAVFITITVLIAIGLVVPLAGLFRGRDDTGGAQSTAAVQKSLGERLAELEEKAAGSPGDKELLMELAETYLYAGKPDQAVLTYEKVLAQDPGFSKARLEMATVYFYSGRYDQSVEQLKKVIESEPDNADAHYLLGIVLGAGKKDFAAGMGELEKFIALKGEGPEAEKARQIIDEWKNIQGQGQAQARAQKQ